jgi:alpha-1,3-mannosyltransferase
VAPEYFMKVIHVVRQFHPSVGGMEEVVLNIARRHRDGSDDEVEVVTLDRVFNEGGGKLAARDTLCGVPVRRIGYAGSTRYPLAPAVLGAVASADLLHVHGIDFFFDYLALTRMLHGMPMVASTHGGFFHTAYASILKRLWFHSLTRASAHAYRRIIATSENDGEIFSAVVPDARLRVIQNGVDVEKFAGRGSASPGKCAIYFGRWSVNKGIPEMLELFRHLVALDPEWRLVIAGRPYDLSHIALRVAIIAHGLQAHVRIEDSPSQAGLADLLRQAQYFLCLSRHEGFGIAPVEAMSAGLIPLLSDIPPFTKLILESGVGLVVPAADPGLGARRLRGLAELDASAFAVRRRQAMAYAALYDWDEVVDCYRDEYRRATTPVRKTAA